MKTTPFLWPRSFTAFSAVFLLISCTRAHVPQEKYLETTSLSGIENVAVLVTISSPEVVYHRTQEIWAVLGLTPYVIGPAIQASIWSNKDKAHAEALAKNFNFRMYEEKLAQSFIKTLNKSSRFENIDYKKDNKLDNQQLSSDKYEGVIRLFLNDLVLQKVSDEHVKLSASITGQMVNLKSSEVIWKRDDSSIASKTHTLDYYKKNGLQELDTMLIKEGKKLAYDFLYLK